MTPRYPRTLAARFAALSAAGTLLASCSSNSPTHAATPAAPTRSKTTSSTSSAAAAKPSAAPITATSAAETGATAACALVTEKDVTSTIGGGTVMDPNVVDKLLRRSEV